MAGLYIHIPFCHSKCAYCDFYSTPNSKLRSQLIKSLIQEWKMRKHELNGEPVKTIYIGGGTPSILSIDELIELLSPISTINVEEFTIEANPEDINTAWVNDVKELGCNRISIGVQSLQDNELTNVGRRHTAADALKAIDIIKDAGIQNISADLIYGLPEQTIESWKYSLTKLLSTDITHLSSYALSYEPGTRLYSRLMSGRIKEASDETYEKMYNMLCQLTSEAGFIHYEISNFSLPGFHSHHNSSYWNYTPYLGIGPGAHSFDGNIRRMNAPQLNAYIKSISNGVLFCESESPSPTEAINEAIITGFRTSAGLNPLIIGQRWGNGYLQKIERNIARFIKHGKIVRMDDGTFRIPEKYWLISDLILRDIII